MRFSVLGSGSGGNGAVVAGPEGALLIDVGLSAKQMVTRLAHIGLAPSAVRGVLLTHEHGDHVRGLDVLMRGPLAGVPVFANAHTSEIVRRSLRSRVAWRLVETGSWFEWAGWRIETFSVPHDAVDPMGFVIERAGGDGGNAAGTRLGVISDLGHATTAVIDRLRELDGLFVEANYCPQLLAADTRRPWSTKQRISSRHGHLSNDQAAELVTQVMSPRLRRLWLGHLSSDCNRPEVATAVLRRALHARDASHIEIYCASQHEPTPFCAL
ncbi:MAG: MBL fold metallo-hydrolase [Verrucomicrobiales bacterium]